MTYDIIRMAREAGGYDSPQYPDNLVMDIHDLNRFAALVAAAEREACAKRAGVALLGGSREISDRVISAICERPVFLNTQSA